MSVWYGTSVAPAPDEAVQAGTEIAITVGVWPVDAGNMVQLLYRANRGPTQTVSAEWLWNDPSGKAQYFKIGLPASAFRAGDTVEYAAVCRCAGRQVPSPEEAQQFTSSFHVLGVGEKGVEPTRDLPPEERSSPQPDTVISSSEEDVVLPADAFSQPVASLPEASLVPTAEEAASDDQD